MRLKNEPFTGTHLLANLLNCSYDIQTLDALSLKSFLEELCERYTLTVLGGYYHDFDSNGAVTGVCVLSESHISVHTWPELNYVTLDIFLCNYHKDNSAVVPRLLEDIQHYFNPLNTNFQIVNR